MGARRRDRAAEDLFREDREGLRRDDVYMISDEVICGFGRLGRAFGCEAVGFRPHGISVAKALSSAYLPIAGVMLPETMYQALLTESRKLGGFNHGFTYSGHPVAAAVAVKTLEIYARDTISRRRRRACRSFSSIS